MTTQHGREVLQLWLVKEPADELVADTHAEYVEPQVKKDAFLFLHETHMAEAATTRALQYYTNRGWKAYGQAAHPTGQGGHAGGFLTLHSYAPRG